jgi:hypothetical protein
MAWEIQIFSLKLSIIQFYDIEHISKSDRWIRLKFYEGSFDIFHLRLKFEGNDESVQRTRIGEALVRVK